MGALRQHAVAISPSCIPSWARRVEKLRARQRRASWRARVEWRYLMGERHPARAAACGRSHVSRQWCVCHVATGREQSWGSILRCAVSSSRPRWRCEPSAANRRTARRRAPSIAREKAQKAHSGRQGRQDSRYRQEAQRRESRFSFRRGASLRSDACARREGRAPGRGGGRRERERVERDHAAADDDGGESACSSRGPPSRA